LVPVVAGIYFIIGFWALGEAGKQIKIEVLF
jgi:hypothetical protein